MPRKKKPVNKMQQPVKPLYATLALLTATVLTYCGIVYAHRVSTKAAGEVAGANNDKGFNQYGYNYKARIFNGTAADWCLARNAAADCMGEEYKNDKLVMKWNAEWDRGNEEGWNDPDGYKAWEDNEWNGMRKNGSGETWRYKIAWDQGCADNGVPSVEGASCIWGQFSILMSQGSYRDAGKVVHEWATRANPNGYGAVNR